MKRGTGAMVGIARLILERKTNGVQVNGRADRGPLRDSTSACSARGMRGITAPRRKHSFSGTVRKELPPVFGHSWVKVHHVPWARAEVLPRAKCTAPTGEWHMVSTVLLATGKLRIARRVFGMCKDGIGKSRSVEHLGNEIKKNKPASSGKNQTKEGGRHVGRGLVHQEDERIQEGVHEDRYSQGLDDGSGARKSLGV